MLFVSWHYIGKYKGDSRIYNGYESCVTTHCAPKDFEHFEILEEWTRDKTIAIQGFQTVTTTILNITTLG